MLPPHLDIDRRPFDRPQIFFPAHLLTRECTPKILCVADGGLDFSTGGFGLSEFVDILKASSIHGMTPIIETAHRSGGTADIAGNFVFTNATLRKSKYDVVFLFGINSGSLPQSEVDVIAKFMQDGGGLFGTGDHSTLGRELCGNIPRLRAMRYWEAADVPSAGGFDRLTTNHPGVDNVYVFDDQSDTIPQRIYPAYYDDPVDPFNNALSKPHYILQHPTKNVIEVLPDHPHEGECVVPDDLATTFVLDGNTEDEFPEISPGNRQSPEIIAKSMSAGGGFPGKEPVLPREFGAICVYDGHEVDVGRVSTDATWHHFININIIPTFAGDALLGPDPANPLDAYERVATYYHNIAEWLMPETVRRCYLFLVLDWVRAQYPLIEFLATPLLDDDENPDFIRDLEIGQAVEASLKPYLTPASINQLKRDIVNFSNSSATGKLDVEAEKADMANLGRRFAAKDVLGQAVLGAAVQTIDRSMQKHKGIDSMVKELGGRDEVLAAIGKDVDRSTKRFDRQLGLAIDQSQKKPSRNRKRK